MPQFVRPPVFDRVPYGGSLGATVMDSLSTGVRDFMDATDREEAKRKKEREQAIAEAIGGEDRLLQLAPLMSEFEEAPPTPMVQPASEELGLPESKAADVPLGPRLAKPLLTEITLPTGAKVPVPPVRGSRERGIAEREAELRQGTEVLTPEAWEKLPPFFKERWKPGQRIDSSTMGSIGMAMYKAAAEKETTIPNYKPVHDREIGKDVQASDAMIAQNPDRYGPPQEARLTAAEDRRARDAERRSDKADAAAIKAEEADAKVKDAADQIASGVPLEMIPSSVRASAERQARSQGVERIYTKQAQKDKVLTFGQIEKDADRLTELLSNPKVASYFGVAAGPLTGMGEKLPQIPILGPLVAPGLKIPDDVMEARSLALNLQDRTLRQRSGAQINPTEMKRITAFSPDPNHNLNKTLINLSRMRQEITDLINGQFTGPSPRRPIKAGDKIGRFTVESVE